MTEQEAKAWKEATQKSKFSWKIDRQHSNANDLLCYQGAETGQFVHIVRDDNSYRLDIGTYIGGIPADYTVMGKRHFTNFPDTMEYLQKRIGITLTR